MISLFSSVVTYVRNICYNFWLGNEYLSVSTPFLYRKMLDEVDEGASILEVGVGSGMPLISNQELIMKKKLKIHGIDIDEQYLQYCKTSIEKSSISAQVTIEKRDIFDVSDKYDVIVFSESYPVIPEKIMEKMVEHCRKILTPGGKIMFVHNLLEKDENLNHPIAQIKPYIKYIPFVWVDFGRATTKKHFDEWLNRLQLKYYSKVIFRQEIPRVFGDYKIEQYLYVAE